MPPARPAPRLLVGLTAAFGIAVAWSAIKPVHLQDYFIEMATPVAGFVVLAATFRRFAFTPLAYVLLFLEMLILIVGAHYTHAAVPLFDWIKEATGGSRNHYDRLAHFGVGFLMSIPVREFLLRNTPLRGAWLGVLTVVSLLAFAGFYEITEWWIAIGVAPDAAEAYLGSQGDPWDAQKDMLLDTVGAAAGLLCFARLHDRQLGTFDDRPTPSIP